VPEGLLQQLKTIAEWNAVLFEQDDLPEAAKEQKLQA